LDAAAGACGFLLSRLLGVGWLPSLAITLIFAVSWHFWWTGPKRREHQASLGVGLLGGAVLLLVSLSVQTALDERSRKEGDRRENEARRLQENREQEAERRDLQLRLSGRRSGRVPEPL
jgi:beta-lactamase regulating signal transducer with metallopeptidase domain